MQFYKILLSTGTYFIDPNSGMIDDAFEVECSLSGNVEWTCIDPIQELHVRLYQNPWT